MLSIAARALSVSALILLAPSGRCAAQGARTLAIVTSAGYLPGVPVLVRVEVRNADGAFARDLWDAEAALTADPPAVSLAPDRVTLRNGAGSALVTLQGSAGAGDVRITAASEGLDASRLVRSLEGQPMASVSGDVAGPLTEWSGIVHVTGPVNVPAGRTLSILAGTLVLVDGVASGENGISLTVRGVLQSLGTEESPVTITASNPARAWGEVHHNGASPSLYRYTIITRAGNSPRGGHTNTGPAVRATDSAIRFENSSITDTAGKSMQASGSSLEFYDCLLSRSRMGPEIDGTALICERSFIGEMYGPDDDDGIYLHGQRAGQVLRLTSCVVASGDDDGIDTLGSVVTVEDCIVRDWRNPDEDSKGISVFSGEVDVRRCLIVNNKVGISAKSQNGGSATVRMERTTVAGFQVGAQAQVGIQAEDKFGEPNLRIRYFVDSSVVRAPDAVKTDYPPADLMINFSDLSVAWAGTGNITDDPLFVSAAGNDYHLRAGSPAIDAGNPAAPADADGSRADMGVYDSTRTGAPGISRGFINSDQAFDISDPFTLLLYLLGEGPIACLDAADADDDGRVVLGDALYLLDYLFLNGPAPAFPAFACGADPGEDTLGCDSPVCR